MPYLTRDAIAQGAGLSKNLNVAGRLLVVDHELVTLWGEALMAIAFRQMARLSDLSYSEGSPPLNNISD